MRKTRGWTGLGAAAIAIALTLSLGSASGAQAAALSTDSLTSSMSYTTLGNIGTQGVTGVPIISFNGVDNNQFTAPSSFSLGSFHVGGLLPGQSTTYNNTPFQITFETNTVNGSTPVPNQTPIVINGVLNGTISGSSQSSVVATFDTTSLPQFQTGLYQNTLNIFDNPVSLVPMTTNGGLTTAEAQILVQSVNPPPAPEPATAAIFVMAIAGYGLRRWFRSPLKCVKAGAHAPA
jgi:hypothetical protein